MIGSNDSDSRTVRAFLTIFRAVSLAIAAGLLVMNGYTLVEVPAGWVAIGIISVYAVYKIIFPFRTYRHGWLTDADLCFDFGSCLAIPFFTSGISSPFLLYLYSLVLTSALFFQKKYTIPATILEFVAMS